jgi:putative ABC transport system ATP-binding protein
MTSIVEATGLVKAYSMGAARVAALRGVSLEVAAGEIVAIMGHSGCGKTTLLNCLAGLDTIDDGEICIAGEPLHLLSERRRTAYRARHMGFIFQSFNLLPVLNAVENVELPLLIVGKRPREARLHAREALAAVGMERWERHKPAQLSGGQQQRVSIARALVNTPAIIWADEPTGNLDSATAGMVMDLIARLNRENGQTFVIVTHDPAVGARAGRIVHMQDGLISHQQSAISDQLTAIGNGHVQHAEVADEWRPTDVTARREVGG